MESAAQVLKNPNLVEFLSQFQNGLPIELMEITCLAQSITITPCYTQTSRCPKAYLSNIPPRFFDTPYLQLFKSSKELPNYALFLDDHYKEPTLPLHLSIVENNIQHVEMWIKHKPEWLTRAPLKLAAICGHLEMVERLVNASKEVWTPEAMDLAAMNGHLALVKYLHGLENGPGCTSAAMDGAAAYGHVEVVAFLNENRTEGCTAKALHEAVNNGYAKVVEYLLNYRHERYSSDNRFFISEYYRIQSHRAVEKKDYIGVIQCLHSHRFAKIGEDLIMTAIKANPLPTIQFLCTENIYGVTKRVLDALIEIGNKDAIRYALEIILTDNNKSIALLDCDNEVDPWTPLDNAEFLSRCNWTSKEWNDSRAMDLAAAIGDLDTLKLLNRTGIKCCTVNAMHCAAAIGRLDIVQWLHTHRTEGCTDDAMTYAIAGGHFEMVRWLHEVRGLNCTTNALSTAASNGNVDIVKYLISLPMVAEIVDPKVIFGRCSSTSVFMHGIASRIKIYRGIAVDQAVSNGHINIVQILRDYPATTRAMDNAASNGHLDMIKYLHTYRTEGCTLNAYSAAVKINRVDILEYLVTNKCYHGVVDFEQFCVFAAGFNHIEILAYCMNQIEDNIAPKFKQLMMHKATMRGHLDVVKWLHEVKGFGSTSLIQAEAERRGHNSIVQYLDSIGNCEDSIMDDECFRLLY